MTDKPTDPKVRIRFDILDGDQVWVWTREGMSREEVVVLLRTVADGFEHDTVDRIR